MGLFTDSLKLGAGVTLGSAATIMGIEKATSASEESVAKRFKKHRAMFYDPIIRTDLCHLQVDGKLQNIEYPFPEKVTVINFAEIQNDFEELFDNFSSEKLLFVLKKYPWISFLLVLIILALFRYIHFSTITQYTVFVIIWRLLFSRTKKFQKSLIEDGKQYWYIREYVRQALDINELTEVESIEKLLKARLVQQFPDTVEEIEAHAFFYRQEQLKSQES